MSATPTQRTLAYYRKQGWTIATVEKWNHHAQIRQDLFGFADLIAFNESEVILIQCTSASNMGKRIDKIRNNQHALRWLQCGKRSIMVVGWRQLVVRNRDGTKAKRKRWTPKIIDVQNVSA